MEKQVTFIEGDVSDPQLMERIMKQYQFAYIFHLAAVASVADSVERPLETHRVNFDSALLLLELVRKYQSGLKRLVFSSSAAVYGDEPTLPKKEESVIRPLTPYAIDKFAAEEYVLDYCHLYDVPTSAVRFFIVYGPNQNPNSPYSGVISILVDRYKKQLAKEKAEFTLFGDGSQSRDFVYIEDVIQALLLVAKEEKALGQQFNVGTGKSTTLLELIQLPKKEESVIRPLTPYAIDKFAAEQYFLDYHHLYDVPTSAVRFFNVYGPNQNPNSPYSGVISILVDRYKKQLVGEKAEFTLFGDGSQSRDFVYIEDVIQALLLVAKEEKALGQQFNVGTGKSTTLLELIHSIDQILGTELTLKYEAERSGDIRDSLADISKIRSLGYQPKFDILSGMERYLKSEIN